MVSRVTYFPLVMDKVLKYFSRFVTELKHNCQDLWLEFEGQPLKWFVCSFASFNRIFLILFFSIFGLSGIIRSDYCTIY